MLFVYAVHAQGWDDLLLRKRPHEAIAIAAVAAAALVCLNALLRSRNLAHALLLVVATSFLIREIHFPGSDALLYVGLAGFGVLAFLWRRRLPEALDQGQLWPWSTSTAWVYLLSQLIARRVFRFLPEEELLHVPLEEVVENVAHAMLIVAGFSDLMPRGRRRLRPGREVQPASSGATSS